MKAALTVVEFVAQTARTGDLHPAAEQGVTSQEGIQAHKRWQNKQGQHYQAEKPVKHKLEHQDLSLQIGGRIDGYIKADGVITMTTIEEIKTTRAKQAQIPQGQLALYWAQLKVYGALIVALEQQTELNLRLTCVDPDHGNADSVDKIFSAQQLTDYLQQLLLRFYQRAKQQHCWSIKRNQHYRDAEFPLAQFRPGQRFLSAQVYRNMRQGQQQIIEAPTGSGKTLGTLFPAVKGLSLGLSDRIFYLSAKISGQKSAVAAIEQLDHHNKRLRYAVISAKQSTCFNPGTPCDPQLCEFARGYYDKEPAAIEQSWQLQHFDRAAIEDLAKAHQLCPFELSLGLSETADVVIADFNYLFDPLVHLRRHFDSSQKLKRSVLVDEAHNLIERGRDMYSAQIDLDCLQKILRGKQKIGTDLKHALTKTDQYFQSLSAHILGKPGDLLSPAQGPSKQWTSNEIPAGLVQQLAELLAQMMQEPSNFGPELQQLGLDLFRLHKACDWFDQHCLVLIEDPEQPSLRLHNLNPAPHLQKMAKRCHSISYFSATLAPYHYSKQLLGLNQDHGLDVIPSPYNQQNLKLLSTNYVDTRYQARTRSLPDIVDSLINIISAKSGHYVVYFPSYSYLNKVYQAFSSAHPDTNTFKQEAGMSVTETNALIQQLEKNKQQTLLGFATLGGSLAEAVDLPGKALIGVIIVSVGLPQLNPQRQHIADYFANGNNKTGFDYAYLYPGFNRVLQTIGRVIRSETDQGVVCLLDQRYSQSQYQNLFPSHWQPQAVDSAQQLSTQLNQFWQGLVQPAD